MDNLHRIAVKIFANKGDDINPYEFVGVLQRWIQKHTVPGTLIDVADYSHMHHGPGVILVAHEHHTSVDYVDGRMGLLYLRKQPLDGSLQDDIRLCTKYALMAAEELQNEPEFKGRLEFDASTVRVVANDRLNVPHEEPAMSIFADAVGTAVGDLYDAKLVDNDARERVAVDLSAKSPGNIKSVVGSLSAQAVG